jgi:hypothetical protein
VVAVASARIGLGLTVEPASPHDAGARAALWTEAARIGRARAQRAPAQEAHAPADWHGLSLPMPGGICGVLAVDRPVTRVQAFGWDRPLEATGRTAVS